MSMTELGLGKVTDDARTASCNAALVIESRSRPHDGSDKQLRKTLGHPQKNSNGSIGRETICAMPPQSLLWRAGIAKGMHVLDLGAKPEKYPCLQPSLWVRTDMFFR